jgi:hypothetical protein
MAVLDLDHLERLKCESPYADEDEAMVCGVPLTLPVGNSRKEPERTWKRRVIPDLVPDYPLADKPEKSLYRILNRLTDAQKTEHSLEEALHGEFGPLKPLYQTTTLGKKSVPVAFHVLAVRSLRGRMRYRVFKEKTFLLLCRDEHGRLDEELVSEFLERYRRPSEELELSQSLVVERLEPNWDSEHEFSVALEPWLEGPRPFLARPGKLFRRDLRTLLSVPVPQSEFFRLTNQLFFLHFGLYQSRLATVLNPALRAVLKAIDTPASVDAEDVELIESGRHSNHQFQGVLPTRAPAAGQQRALPVNAPEHTEYERQSGVLTRFHFSLLMLNRLREMTKDYLRAQGIEEAELVEMTRMPSQFVNRLQVDEEYLNFIRRGFEVLSLKFIDDELGEEQRERALEIIRNAPSGAHALRDLYEFEARTGISDNSKNRAIRTGIQVLDSILKREAYGIIQSRSGVGKYFGLGPMLIPLLLLLVIGTDREKVQLAELWRGIGRYGLDFKAKERELLLSRMKAMGLYERYSDAGEANYVRALMGAR